MFGEILSKLNLQPDFDKFRSDGTPDAMINNFMRLYPTFKQLGVKFDSNVANTLMREEKGSAAQLLYSIKRVRTCTCVQHIARLTDSASS